MLLPLLLLLFLFLLLLLLLPTCQLTRDFDLDCCHCRRHDKLLICIDCNILERIDMADKASDNLFGELGPVCTGGKINVSFPSSRSQWTCTGTWKGKVKFGAPHVVDLGQELEHSPDADGVKRAYMVGHGADKEYQPQSWMHGSQVCTRCWSLSES